MKLKDKSLLKDKCYVNGKWVDGHEGKTFEVTNPYDQSTIISIANFDKEDTRNTILAAEKAQKEWKKTTAGERSQILRKWFDLMIEHKEDLGKILTLEQGKPLPEAIGEIAYGASFVEWFAEEAKRTYGDVIPGHQADKRIITIKQPVGVVAAITPWNFPNAMITRKVGPALAAGCSIVVKPAKYTPLSALALGELAERAGIPKGVFNVITSNRTSEIGQELTENPIIRKLSFTGSTEVGKTLIKACADTVKKVSMELGGNAPFIVFADADIDKAVEGAIASKYRNAGQTCVCSNRFFVHDEIYDEFTSKLKKAVSLLKVGNGFDEGVQIGPLIDKNAVKFVQGIVNDATNKGASIELGGKVSSENDQIFLPTILSNVKKGMDVYTEEIFGPIVPIFRFQTEDEVIEMANDTPFGLAAYFYGRDYQLVWRVAEALEYGMVGINTGMISTTVAPFGGIKESGFGKEGSKYGIDEYLEIKYMCFG
ncbi:NAD-dependent succinate-semialdehyde dehydrogenase [Flammeovirga kamogawensis]|uniref:Succinate-semialdehyde dehydrogenase n=1 Tax=Flammeovirga kamogawensis TaxID=373891 RepID=A0ABX8H1N9_9BACT|nr:NAD-dependent succinate-semialdehyde dehydrogenase [Flammeovirga kamogawensis]MBB6462637.1 succinate-semialdehyde dehydrogenase/glutarate-semialdehyde dehydrogenase [Flammeovirga kamogawensis]QWG09618.1 succinate-semialdehyde dehydrogenase [Flammeovirga kamogawensis]